MQYLYVTQICADGCYVVFDLDTEDNPGYENGEKVEFEEAFEPYLPALFAGEEIEPIESNDISGWVLTAYCPICDASGRCVAYAGADVSMSYMADYMDLKSVTFPDSLKRVDFQAFDQCSSLTEVNFPDHLVETSSETFEGTPWLEAQRKANPLVIINGALVDGKTCKGDVTVPAGVKYVAGSAFAYNTDLTSIVLPSSAATVEANVFVDCEKLTSATLKGVTDLDYCAFGGCSQLTDLKLSGKLKSINSGTFEENTATATITFYGTEDTWKAVEKDPEDAFLNRATMIFDPNGAEPDEPEDDPVIGDINKDGSCDMSDAVLLMGWLLKEDVTLADWEAGDMDKDGKLNAADFTLLKRHLFT